MIRSKKIAEFLVKLSTFPDGERRVARFLAYLRKKRLEWIFPNVLKELKNISQRDEYCSLVVESSHPFSEEKKQKLQKIFSTNDLKEKINENVVLGQEYYFSGRVYHGSVRWSLEKLRKRFLELSKTYED